MGCPFRYRHPFQSTRVAKHVRLAVGWCAVVEKWVALDEGVSDCLRLQRCTMAVCPKAHVFVPIHPEPALGGGQTAAINDSCGSRT